MQLAHPTTLSEALKLAIERKILGNVNEITPIFRAAGMSELHPETGGVVANKTI